MALPGNPYVRQTELDIELAGKQGTPPEGDTQPVSTGISLSGLSFDFITGKLVVPKVPS